MHKALSLILIFTSLLVCNAISYFVFMRNLSAHIYPADGDTIAIPIFEDLVLSVIVLFACAIAIYFTKKNLLARLIRNVLWLIALLIPANESLYWITPNHYEIAVFNFLVLLCVGIVAFLQIRKIHTNSFPENGFFHSGE